ncbi:hypothetical protein PUNSTDRAFT_114758 [Punctularia strigosozonata HHB-11173 SS5]|uniref:uncharacterized protein n=1 Tax=Punctularia strigosozonata (strain HHB-11173) TaxID=741275 RepID=UPI0004417D89|nr:uncharacterized protein PUNSTDRAFT_114758 [Punctularia strigosozonata HHB-11173 SS5]EIN07296.1 hypothetical protein PUNSTDRAFT_114758 [Punctularia strigosozonata HHB-11173 SS5]
MANRSIDDDALDGGQDERRGALMRKPNFNEWRGVRPVTIYQLKRAEKRSEDAKFTIENHEIHHVCVVAHVVSIDTETGENVYMLEDGTGRIKGRQYEEDIEGTVDDPDGLCGVARGTFARVIGILKLWKIFKTLQVLHVRPAFPAELEYHCFNVIACTLMLERGLPPAEQLPRQYFVGTESSNTTSSTNRENSSYIAADFDDASTEVDAELSSLSLQDNLPDPGSISCVLNGDRFRSEHRHPQDPMPLTSSLRNEDTWASFSATVPSGSVVLDGDPYGRMPFIFRKVLLAIYEAADPSREPGWTDIPHVARLVNVTSNPGQPAWENFLACLRKLKKKRFIDMKDDMSQCRIPQSMYEDLLRDEM